MAVVCRHMWRLCNFDAANLSTNSVHRPIDLRSIFITRPCHWSAPCAVHSWLHLLQARAARIVGSPRTKLAVATGHCEAAAASRRLRRSSDNVTPCGRPFRGSLSQSVGCCKRRSIHKLPRKISNDAWNVSANKYGNACTSIWSFCALVLLTPAGTARRTLSIDFVHPCWMMLVAVL